MTINRYFQITFEIASRTDLNSNDKLVYCFMLNDCEFYLRTKKHYSPAKQKISDGLGISKRTVDACIKNLIKVGLIEQVNQTNGGTNSYMVYEKAITNINEKAPETDSNEPSVEPEQSNVEPEIIEQEAIQEASEPIVVRVINQDYRSWNKSQETVDYAAIAQANLEDRYSTGNRNNYRSPQTVTSFSNIPF